MFIYDSDALIWHGDYTKTEELVNDILARRSKDGWALEHVFQRDDYPVFIWSKMAGEAEFDSVHPPRPEPVIGAPAPVVKYDLPFNPD